MLLFIYTFQVTIKATYRGYGVLLCVFKQIESLLFIY